MGRIDRRLARLEGQYGLDAESRLGLQERVLGEALARSSDEVLKAIEDALSALGEGPAEEEISFDALRAMLPEEQARHISVLQTEYISVAGEWGLDWLPVEF